MSLHQNDVWLEAAMDIFHEALQDGKYSFARAVIDDVKHRGFPDVARVMTHEINNTPLKKFVIESPYGNL